MRARSTIVVGAVAAASWVGAAGGAAAERQPAARPGWALVFQHYDAARHGFGGLDVVSSNQPRPRPLTRPSLHSGALDDSPKWSPDGRRVAFARLAGDWGLYVVGAGGGKARRLARGEPETLAWSPDGTRIAFSRKCRSGSRPCNPGIYVAHLDGGRLTRVLPVAAATTSEDYEQTVPALSWAPDGRRLICRCGRGVYLVAVDGSSHSRLDLSGRGVIGSASWSPDGSLIAVEEHCTPARAVHDFYCDVAFVTPDGAGRTPRHGSDIWMGSSLWTSEGMVLGTGFGVIEIDPPTGARRVVSRAAGWLAATGPAGSIALLRDRTVAILDREGRTLVRDVLPAGVALDSDTAILLR